MKKRIAKFSKPSRAEARWAAKALRYMNPNDLAREFRGKREKAAIAAVFRWMSLNFVCAWRLKRPGHYRTNVRRRGFLALKPQAYVLDKPQWEAAEKALGLKDY